MKPVLLLPLVLALPAFAGTPAPVAPAPEPCLMSWFAGGSIGYLTELEEPMYNLHVGVTDSCWKVVGCNVSLFLEVGYTQKDESYQPNDGPGSNDWDNGSHPSFTLDELERYLQGQANDHEEPTSYDLQVIPITLNVKLDRALTGNLNAYLGAGMGIANVDLDATGDDVAGGDGGTDRLSADDWVFTAQVFGGLSYNFTPAFEVYGGARWIYYQDADLGGGNTLKLESDCLLELGARYKF